MKPELQRLAIAEACGWTLCRYDDITLPWFETKDGKRLGDPMKDLNAMHEAEKVLQHLGFYHDLLADVMGVKRHSFSLITATAAQRAEAFLKCLGLWTDAEKQENEK